MSESLTVGFVFARGGSKGVPRKNLRVLAGATLIEHAIAAARACSLIDRVVVSTDDEEIAGVATAAGAEVPFMRPSELAADDAAELLSWKHALRELTMLGWPPIETFVSVPATAPLRRPDDVDGCIRMLRSSGADVALTVYDSGANPYFNLVVEQNGWYRPFASSPAVRRQDAPRVMRITPMAYAAVPGHISNAERLMDGRIAGYEVPAERALDIDTEHDFKLAELLMAQRAHAPRR